LRQSKGNLEAEIGPEAAVLAARKSQNSSAGDRDAQKQVAAKSGAHPERQTLSEKWGNWEEERGQTGKSDFWRAFQGWIGRFKASTLPNFWASLG
jgi:hypothetical protein